MAVGIKIIKKGEFLVLKRVSVIVMIFLLFVTASGVAEEPEYVPPQAYVAIDAITGRILMSSNENEKLGMASTTKIMTGILAIEKGNFNDIVTIGKNPPLVEGSKIYVSEGEKITLETLVYGLLLKSGNDAAIAIAEYIGGSEAEFVNMMNEKAKELGLENTNFTNPHGLYHENHYTTAYELALIGRYAMKNPVFSKIVSEKMFTETPPEDRDPHVIYNANKLLSMYEEADGIKPGFTPETGRTLVGSATKNGWRVITVTLNCPDDWKEHKKLFDYVFETYELKKIKSAGDPLGTFRVSGGKYSEVGVACAEDIEIPVKKSGEEILVEVINETIEAPVQEGQIISCGGLNVACANDYKFNLCTNSSVEVKSKNLFHAIGTIFKALFGVITNE